MRYFQDVFDWANRVGKSITDYLYSKSMPISGDPALTTRRKKATLKACNNPIAVNYYGIFYVTQTHNGVTKKDVTPFFLGFMRIADFLKIVQTAVLP